MANIQQNLNQLLTTAGIMERLSPEYEKKVEGLEAVKKAVSASRGLVEQEEHLLNKEKEYNEIELRDIERRAIEENKIINDAKVLELSNKYAARAIGKAKKTGDIAEQSTHSEILSNIQSSIKSRLETLEGQKAGLTERKEILKSHTPEKRILQMKNASARAENREKAIASVVPKGGN